VENFDRAMKISTGNGSAIVDMRTLIYLACIRRAIGTNTAVIKNIRSTERNWVLQSDLKFKVLVRANYYRAISSEGKQKIHPHSHR